MTDRKELEKAIGGVVAGYVFLYFDFNLFVVNVLPDWLGYVAFVHVLDVLNEEESSAKLLRPLGILLTVWSLLESVLALLKVEANLTIVTAVIASVSLYFHFQLLTNVAEIARRYEYPRYQNIIRLRTVRTLLITAFTVLPLAWQESQTVSGVIGFVGVAAGVWTCMELNAFRKTFLEDSTDNRVQNEP